MNDFDIIANDDEMSAMQSAYNKAMAGGVEMTQRDYGYPLPIFLSGHMQSIYDKSFELMHCVERLKSAFKGKRGVEVLDTISEINSQNAQHVAKNAKVQQNILREFPPLPPKQMLYMTLSIQSEMSTILWRAKLLFPCLTLDLLMNNALLSGQLLLSICV